MRITEAIEKSRRGLAWRPYYSDLSLMEDERIAKKIYAGSESGPFWLHWADTGFRIGPLAAHDDVKVRGYDDWRPVEPIPDEVREAVCSAGEEPEEIKRYLEMAKHAEEMGDWKTGARAREKVEELEKLRASYERESYRSFRGRLYGIPYYTSPSIPAARFVGLDRKPFITMPSKWEPIKWDEGVKVFSEEAPLVKPATPSECVALSLEKVREDLPLLYEWEASMFRSLTKHDKKLVSIRKMRIPFFRRRM